MSLSAIEIIGAQGCPYVQRVLAYLIHSNIPFNYKSVDLQNKPDWFLEKSPLGKVPLLRYPDGKFIFESAIINDYLDDSLPQEKRLSPSDPFTRASNKAWLEFVGNILTDVYAAVAKTTKEEFETACLPVANKYQQLETQIKGPYFNGDKISLVDLNIAPMAVRLVLSDEAIGVDVGDKKKLPKVNSYFNTLRSIPAISTSQFLQKQPDAANPHTDIQALHDKPVDPNVWEDFKVSQLKSFLEKRFPSSYIMSLIK